MIVLPSKGHTNKECGVNIMKVRLGFVALVLGLDKVTTSSTLMLSIIQCLIIIVTVE